MKKRIAILILAHKMPGQLNKLIREFDDSRFQIFVHIDRKSDICFQSPDMKNTSCKVLVHDLRVSTYLNDFSLVDATMTLVKAALADGDFKYFVLLTGQDYPIKSNDGIYNTLMDSYPTCWIDSYGVEDARRHGVKWVENVGHKRFSQHIRKKLINLFGPKIYYSKYGKLLKVPAVVYDKLSNILAKSPRSKIRDLGLTYSVGSHFWILPDIAMKHIIDIYESNHALNNVFRHIAAPEESYFQTVLSTMPNAIIPDPYNQFSSQDAEMDNPALRLIKWYENGAHTSGHPANWNTSDMEMLTKAKALFARKFDGNIDILSLIDNTLR